MSFKYLDLNIKYNYITIFNIKESVSYEIAYPFRVLNFDHTTEHQGAHLEPDRPVCRFPVRSGPV